MANAPIAGSSFLKRQKPLAALLFDVDENKLTGEEIQLLSRWKQLDIRQKKVIMDTIEAFGKTE